MFIAFSAGLIVALKEALSFLPNVELVTFLLMEYAVVFSLSFGVSVSIIFCFVQMLLYGMGTWTIVYFVVWPLIVLITYKLKDHLVKKADYMALLSGFFGIVFGSCFSIPYLIIGGPNMAISYILNGLIYDIIHMGANYIIMLILFKPVYQQLVRIQGMYHIQ